MVDSITTNLNKNYRQKYNLSDDEYKSVIKGQLSPSKTIDIFVDVNKKYMSLKQVQNFNVLYSSEEMKHYRKIVPLMTKDLILELDEAMERAYAAH